MKNLIYIIFFISLGFAQAQSVSLANSKIKNVPLELAENNGESEISFILVESSSSDVPASAFGMSNITISVDLSYVALKNEDVSKISGDMMNYFMASYNSKTNILTFKQKKVYPGDASAMVKIPIVVTNNSTDQQRFNGFNANIAAIDSTTNAEGNAATFTFTQEAAIDDSEPSSVSNNEENTDSSNSNDRDDLDSNGENTQSVSDNELINSNDNSFKMNFYPNPVINELNFMALRGDSSVKSVNVFDAKGRLVYEVANVYDNKVDVSNLNAGLYFIQVKTQNTSITKKILKK